MPNFEQIAPYLKDPLILTGFAIFLFFGFCRHLVKSGVIPTLRPTHGFKILRLILLYGFILGLVIMLLAFGLKYREMSEAEQQGARALIDAELSQNRQAVGQLAANLETLIGAYDGVTRSLRLAGNPLVSLMFPEENLRKEFASPLPKDLAESALREISSQGLDRDSEALRKAELVGKVIVSTVDRTKGTIQSLSDKSRTRYVMREDAYRANLPILRKVSNFDAGGAAEAYAATSRLRDGYDVVTDNLVAYLDALSEFFGSEEIDVVSLTKVLTAERLATVTLVAFTDQLVQSSAQLEYSATAHR